MKEKICGYTPITVEKYLQHLEQLTELADEMVYYLLHSGHEDSSDMMYDTAWDYYDLRHKKDPRQLLLFEEED